jgi:hypothetical protein
VPAGFSVLVFDMAHTGDEDGEHRVDGFRSLEQAREYARRRTRASIEELRKYDMPVSELRELWTLFGEDCSVLGDSYCGSSELDYFIAEPAEADECDWSSLAPPRRFHVVASVDDDAGHSAWVGGFLTRPTRPGPKELLRIYADEAKEELGTEPVNILVAHVFELPDVPRPPSLDGCPHWRVDLDFVCHDVKFGASTSGVFAWPEEPAGAVLDEITRLLMAETLAFRGDHPENADYSDVVRRTVERTDAPLTHTP